MASVALWKMNVVRTMTRGWDEAAELIQVKLLLGSMASGYLNERKIVFRDSVGNEGERED